jgi:hypothetical protein
MLNEIHFYLQPNFLLAIFGIQGSNISNVDALEEGFGTVYRSRYPNLDKCCVSATVDRCGESRRCLGWKSPVLIRHHCL